MIQIKDSEVTAKPNLFKKPVMAMIVAHMAANNCFFILFNWLPGKVPAYIISFVDDAI